jgi:hypothetical protein
MRKNVFYGGHWCRWTDGPNNLTLIGTTGEKGFEYDPSSRRLGHYLLMTIPRDMTTWERFMTWAREGTGEHAFDCRILLHAPGTDLHAISKQAMEAQHPLLPVITNRLEPQGGSRAASGAELLFRLRRTTLGFLPRPRAHHPAPL